MKNSIVTIKRALISVYDKTGIVALAKYLSDHDIEILSTGGTAEYLREAELMLLMCPNTPVSLRLWTVALRQSIPK